MTHKKWLTVFLLGVIALVFTLLINPSTAVGIGVLLGATFLLWVRFAADSKHIGREHYEGDQPLSTTYRRYEGL